jgi:uncharacterized membrane protein YgdD (TMEM256/DUF423 family)
MPKIVAFGIGGLLLIAGVIWLIVKVIRKRKGKA